MSIALLTMSQESRGLRHSRLRAVHMRGDCRPFQRTLNDAKHLSEPFRGNRDFRIFMDHGERLREVRIEPLGIARDPAPSSEEKLIFCLDL